MSLFSSLPSETLVQILCDDGLSNADTASLRRVCKRFKHHAFYRKIVFRADAVSHSPWKLARRMLFHDAELGEKCTSFVVQWKWNTVERGINVENWKWTEEEQARIKDICEQWGFHTDIPASPRIPSYLRDVLQGRNSEALLPLLLCYTPNLKSLNIGNLEGDDWRCLDNFELDRPPGSPLSPGEHYLWLLDYLWCDTDENGKVEVFPPLEKLEHFSFKFVSHTPLAECYPIFSFPRIKSISLAGIPVVGVEYNADLGGYQPIGPSTVEELSIVFYCYGHYWPWPAPEVAEEALGALSSGGRLQQVYIRTIHGGSSCECISFTRSENLGRVFLENNKDTLKPTEIIIDGSGFDALGRFEAHAEKRRAEEAKERA